MAIKSVSVLLFRNVVLVQFTELTETIGFCQWFQFMTETITELLPHKTIGIKILSVELCLIFFLCGEYFLFFEFSMFYQKQVH